MIKKNKIFIIFFLLIFIIVFDYTIVYSQTNTKSSKHLHSESSYQHVWCSSHNGIEEFETDEKTRVDCLTSSHAVEFDFAPKWAESIGQALHYELKTGKKAKVVLILENPLKEMIYYNRVKDLSQKYNFDSEYITSSILNIKNGKCPYLDCKCHQ